MSLDEYYRRLDLPSTASPADVKRAYRRLRARYHPDRNKGHESRVEPAFKRVQEAFEILTGKREGPTQARAHRAEEPKKPEQTAPQAGSQPRSTTGARRENGSNHAAPTMRGMNRYSELYVPLEVALNGGEIPTSLEVAEACRRCHGTSSRIGHAHRHPPCAACHGTGIETYRKSHTVNVPPGAWDGQRLLVEGAGSPGVNGGPAGDAIFSVVVVCATEFQRDGLSLIRDLQVDFVTATLGGAFEARVLGRDLQIMIPPYAQHGSIICLRAHGLSDGCGNRGDLRLRLVLAIPPAAKHLTDEQRRILQDMFDDAACRASSTL